MGKLTATQCNMVHQDQIWLASYLLVILAMITANFDFVLYYRKDYVRKEQGISRGWSKEWGFLPDQYREV